MLHKSSAINTFISTEDLGTSSRLGITYEGIDAKALISWEMSPTNIRELTRRGIRGNFSIVKIGNDVSKLAVFPGDASATQSWTFENQKLVSSILAQTRSWSTIESEHFRFIISDSTRFHPANIQLLENFLARMSALLDLSAQDQELLAEEKIIYCFCKDKDEIKQLTGHAPRGMYVLSHDIIMSTYSAHLHELAHLLINFKLRSLNLYTHPLLLEGFAVSTGGRGGKTPEILSQLGTFLLNSEWVSIGDLTSASGFYSQNASISYPCSGTYVGYLIEALGIEKFLKLYQNYGAGSPELIPDKFYVSELQDDGNWDKYLRAKSSQKSIRPLDSKQISNLNSPFAFHRSDQSASIWFGVPDQSLYDVSASQSGYSSFLFEELMPQKKYSGSRYYIRASESEVGVYDLYTNTMIAFYALAFSDEPLPVTTKDSLFYFEIDADTFGEGLQALRPTYYID